jgi:hypothetical protein
MARVAQQLGGPFVRRLGPIRLVTLTGLVVFGMAACTSDAPTTEVRGEVLTRADDLGGPNPAVAEFRAGERAVYGTGNGSGPG